MYQLVISEYLSALRNFAIKQCGYGISQVFFLHFRNKLRRECAKLRAEYRKEDQVLFKKVDGIGFDGRKDATLTVSTLNSKHYLSTVLEEHYVVTGEPSKFGFL